MDWFSVLLKIMNGIQLVVTTCLGSMGIISVCGSFFRPDCGLDAILMLSSATVMTLAVPKPKNPTHRGPRAPREPRLPAKLCEAVTRFRPRS
jgi:hypothetical protein